MLLRTCVSNIQEDIKSSSLCLTLDAKQGTQLWASSHHQFVKQTKLQPDWHLVHLCKVTENTLFLILMTTLNFHVSLALRLLDQNGIFLAKYLAGVRRLKKKGR